MHLLRSLMLTLAAICLGFGLFLPIMRFDSLYFFSSKPSLIDLVGALFADGDIGLALIVGLFSIVFPIAKLIGLGIQMLSRKRDFGHLHALMRHVSKWSMMDVMLVAIVIFAAKTSGIANAVSQPGLWFYAASTIIAGLLPFFFKDEQRKDRQAE